MKLDDCLKKLERLLKDFDTDTIVSAAATYRARGMGEDEAAITAVEDHLRSLDADRARVEGEVKANWSAQDPTTFNKFEGKEQAEPTVAPPTATTRKRPAKPKAAVGFVDTRAPVEDIVPLPAEVESAELEPDVEASIESAVKEAEALKSLEDRAEAEVKAMEPARRMVHAVDKFFTTRQQAAEDAGLASGRDVAETDNAGGGTKKSGAAILREEIRALVDVASATGFITKKMFPLSPRATANGVQQYMNNLLREARRDHPQVADAIEYAIGTGDTERVRDVFAELKDFMTGKSNVRAEDIALLGTVFEPLVTQHRRAVRRAETIANKKRTKSGKPTNVAVREFSSAVQGMYVATRKLLREMAMLTSNDRTLPEEVFGRSDEDAGIAARRADKRLEDAMVVLFRRLNRELDPTGKNPAARIDFSVFEAAKKIWSTPDPIAGAKIARDVFTQLMDLDAKLTRTDSFKLLQSRDKRIADVGRASTRKVAATPTPARDPGKIKRTALGLFNTIMKSDDLSHSSALTKRLGRVLLSGGMSAADARGVMQQVHRERREKVRERRATTPAQARRRDRDEEVSDMMLAYIDDTFNDEYMASLSEIEAADPTEQEEVFDGPDPDVLDYAAEQTTELKEKEADAAEEKRYLGLMQDMGMGSRGASTTATAAGRVMPADYERNSAWAGATITTGRKTPEQRVEQAKRVAAKMAQRAADREAKRLRDTMEKRGGKPVPTVLIAPEKGVAGAPTVGSFRPRKAENLAKLLDLTGLDPARVLEAMRQRYTAGARAAGTFFGTFNEKNSDSTIVGSFISALNEQQRAQFQELVEFFVSKSRRSIPNRKGDAPNRLAEDRKEVIDFVKSMGFAPPKTAQWRAFSRESTPGPNLLDLDTELAAAAQDAAPPEGTILASGPNVARYTPAQVAAREAARKRVKEHNEAAKKAHRPSAPITTYTTHATKESADAVARNEDGTYKPGMYVERVTIENSVGNYLDAMREAVAVGLGRGELILNASPTSIDLIDLETALQAGNFVETFRKLAKSFFKQTEEAYGGTYPARTTFMGLRDAPSADARMLLKTWLEAMTPNAYFRPLFEKFLSLDLTVPVFFVPDGIARQIGGNPTTRAVYVGNDLATNHAIYMAAGVLTNPKSSDKEIGRALRDLAHELSHAMTVRMMRDAFSGERADLQPALKQLQFFIEAARAEAALTGDAHYGLKDEFEFVAELYTNKEFRAFLDSITVETVEVSGTAPVKLSLYQRIINWLSNLFFGTEKYATMIDTLIEKRRSVLDEVTPLAEVFVAGTDELGPRRRDGAEVLSEAGRVWKTEAFSAAAVDKGAIRLNGLHEKWQRVHLAAMGVDVIERKYRHLGDRLGKALGLDYNPITRLSDAINRTSKIVRDIGDAHVKLVERTSELEHFERERLYEAMIETTLARVHVDAPKGLLDPANAHLFDAKGDLHDRDAVARAISRYKMMDTTTRKLYAGWRDHLKEEYTLRLAVLTKHAAKMRGMARDEADELFKAIMAGDTDALPIIQKLANANAVPDTDLEDLAATINKIIAVTRVKGPYFPLRREGEFVVTYVDKNQKYVEMYDTYLEAETAKLDLAGRKIEATVTKKIAASESVTGPETLKLVDEVVGRMEAPPGASPEEVAAFEDVHQQMYNATIKLLGDRVLYGAQLRRKGIRGTQVKDMAKSLEEYSRASISAISGIDTAYDYTGAMRDIRKAAVEPELQALGMLPGSQLTQEEQLSAGNLYNEFVLRAKNLATDRDVTNVDRVLGSIGFFTYLGAPSYWVLNATQTAVVGVPVLAGLTGTSYMRAARAMGTAYKQIKALTKGMGWRALSDLNSVIAKLPADQQETMRLLIDDNAIQSTLAFETGVLTSLNSSMATTKTGRVLRPVYNSVTDILQTVPDMIERFNRLAMALAAVELGAKDYAQIKDVVLSSQFNYDSANRARILKYAPGVSGGMRQFWAPMMMFKVFGFNMAELIYGNMYDGFISKAKTPAERQQARRVLYGLIGSHTAFGGVYGGLGLGLGQVVLGAVNSMLDDEDKLDPAGYLESFLREHTNEYATGIITRGLPAAIGIDFSGSVNLGNLLLMSRDNDWAEFGGFEQSVYALLGPVAQYGAGAVREAARFASGEKTLGATADFLEKSVPLKLYKSLSQAFRRNIEGLETRQGQTFMDPSEISAWGTALTAVGLRSVKTSMRQEQFYRDRTWTVTLENRKAEILKALATANTPAARNEARREQQEWNRRMREKGNPSLIIKASSIEQSQNTRRAQQQEYNKGMKEGAFTPYNR